MPGTYLAHARHPLSERHTLRLSRLHLASQSKRPKARQERLPVDLIWSKQQGTHSCTHKQAPPSERNLKASVQMSSLATNPRGERADTEIVRTRGLSADPPMVNRVVSDVGFTSLNMFSAACLHFPPLSSSCLALRGSIYGPQSSWLLSTD